MALVYPDLSMFLNVSWSPSFHTIKCNHKNDFLLANTKRKITKKIASIAFMAFVYVYKLFKTANPVDFLKQLLIFYLYDVFFCAFNLQLSYILWFKQKTTVYHPALQNNQLEKAKHGYIG